jgi:signal transduction histidine kinase
MTQDTMKFIFFFLLGMTGINFFSALIARWKTGHKEFSTLILYWFSLILTYGAVAQLGANPTQIAFAYFFQFGPNIIVAKIFRDSVGIKTNFRNFCLWQVLGMTVTTFLLLYTDLGFTISLLPVITTTILPLIAPIWISLVSPQNYKVVWLDKVLGVMLTSAIINHYNYAFFRLDPNQAWWGWSVSFAQYQFLSIFLPLLINHRREEKEKSYLQSVIEKMSGNFIPSPKPDELYRELDYQIAQKEDFYSKLQLANAQLEDEQEMNEMLIRTISHDLANPLTVVNAYVSMIQGQKIQPDEMPKIYQRIQNNLDSATNMIERIRNTIVTRTQASLLTVDDILLDEAIYTLMERFDTRLREKGMSIIYEPEHTDMKVRAEKNSLVDHVLSNIISNAIKFSFEKSVIQIRATEDSDCIHISIKDSGLGIEKDRLKRRLLSSTFGTKGEPGTGLGILVMGYFVRRFEGTFQINSETAEENRGTLVTVSLKKSISFPKVTNGPFETAHIYN